MDESGDFSINVYHACRSCLTANELININEEDARFSYFIDQFETCTSVKLKEIPNVPIQMCSSCLGRVNDIAAFRQNCVQTQATIKRILNKVKEELNDAPESNEELIKKELTSEWVNKNENYVEYEEKKSALDNTDVDEPSEVDDVDNESLDLPKPKRKRLRKPKEEESKFMCKLCVCDRNFQTEVEFASHNKIMHTIPENQCAICMEKFLGARTLNNHLKKNHPGDVSVQKKFKCGNCVKAYTSAMNLQVHIYTHNGCMPHVCQYCSRGFSKPANLQSHMVLHTGKRHHLCQTCGKGFSTTLLLTRHKMSHTGIRPYSCDFCERTFVTTGDKNVHLRTHTGEKPYLCAVCGQSFSRTSHLYLHRRRHTGEKPYKCQVCDKAFAQAGDLRSHERIHTGIKPYECKYCPKKFSQSSGLASHVKTHHFTQSEYLYCKICHKGFVQKASYKRHMAKEHLNANDEPMKVESQINFQMTDLMESRCVYRDQTVLCAGKIVNFCNPIFKSGEPCVRRRKFASRDAKRLADFMLRPPFVCSRPSRLSIPKAKA